MMVAFHSEGKCRAWPVTRKSACPDDVRWPNHLYRAPDFDQVAVKPGSVQSEFVPVKHMMPVRRGSTEKATIHHSGQETLQGKTCWDCRREAETIGNRWPSKASDKTSWRRRDWLESRFIAAQ